MSRVLQPKVFPQQTFMSAAIFPFKFNTVKWNEAKWNNLYIPVQQAFPRPHCAASLISSHLLRQDRKDLQFLLHFPTLFPILCVIFFPSNNTDCVNWREKKKKKKERKKERNKHSLYSLCSNKIWKKEFTRKQLNSQCLENGPGYRQTHSA